VLIAGRAYLTPCTLILPFDLCMGGYVAFLSRLATLVLVAMIPHGIGGGPFTLATIASSLLSHLSSFYFTIQKRE